MKLDATHLQNLCQDCVLWPCVQLCFEMYDKCVNLAH